MHHLVCRFSRFIGLTEAGSRKRLTARLGKSATALLLAAAASASFAAPTEAQEYGVLGAPGHWCTFNRTCNWTAHASIAFGTTYALHKLDVPLHFAAGAGAALFLGKEIRDHRKWGDFWTFDSLVDLGTGVAGAGIAYWLLKPDESAMPMPYVDPAGRMGLESRLPLL